MLGVTRQAIAEWLKVITSTRDCTTNKSGGVTNPATDSRVKLNPKAKPIIAERVANGEPQAQVASDFGVSQRTISTRESVRTSSSVRTTSKTGAVTDAATDSRVKIAPEAKPIIAERVAKGEPQAQKKSHLGG